MDNEGKIQADKVISEKDKAELDRILREKFQDKIKAANLIINKNKLTVVYEEGGEDVDDYSDNYGKSQHSKFEILSGGDRSTFYNSDNTSLKSFNSQN